MPAAWIADLVHLLEVELAEGSPDDPFRPAVLNWAQSQGRAVDQGRALDPGPLLDWLEAKRVGGGRRRYRWDFPVASWLDDADFRHWRPAEAELALRNRDAYAARLWEPPVVAEHVEWLERVARGPDADASGRARDLLAEAIPTMEDDVARHVQGLDPWADTFMLWMLARRARALTHVRGLTSAIASRYAARAARTDGLVRGTGFPFYDTPMPSATAHLASAAARIGDGLDVVQAAVEWLPGQRNRDGGWGDPGQGSDILTTLAVAELFGQLDPRFDPESALDPLGKLVAKGGPKPELIGPEWPWVAAELVSFDAWARRPFAERFRWPHVPDWMIDRRVQIPRFDAYVLFARLFELIPGLSTQPIEVAFLDMAGFGKWNVDYGMAMGDELLALLASVLREVPDSRAIRDGGDEFLLVGAPGSAGPGPGELARPGGPVDPGESGGLAHHVREMTTRWPEVSRARFPDLPVVPLRAIVCTTEAGHLREARDRLGLDIGGLKSEHPSPPAEGVIVRCRTA